MTALPPELELSKAQPIRLLDVAVVGPLMFWFGYTQSRPPKSLRAAMMLLGIGTVVYNGKNYLAVQREIERRKGITR